MDLLAGERFRVASYGVAAAYAGWLLRQYGGEGEHETALDPEGLGAFLGQGAAFVISPALTTGGGPVLITDAPVNIENRERLSTLAAGAKVIWITPWGIEGPWSDRPASDLALYAAGGWMSAVGEPNRAPLAPPGSQCQFAAGLFATIAALSHFAASDGRLDPGLIDIPIVETVAATMIYDPVAFQYFGRIRERSGDRFVASIPTIVTLPCKDGYIGLHCALYGQWLAMCELIGHPELSSDPRFAMPLERAANWEELFPFIVEWLRDRTRFEAYHELQQARIPTSAHPDVAEVLSSPQLVARGAFVQVQTPSGRELRVPGPPARVRAVSPEPARPRPNSPVWREGCLRVADLTMGWAGPLVTQVLSIYGADVIKVEGIDHHDWWRGSRPPGDDPALALHERAHGHNTVNRGKRGIAVDLSSARGVNIARQLIATADVLVENFGTGVLERFGLDYDELRRENPGLLMVRQPPYGGDGPEAGYRAFGNTMEGMSGLSSLTGYGDGPPTMLSNALGDPISGLNGAVAALSGLAGRRRMGRGLLLECSQLEGFLPLTSESQIEYQLTGEVPRRRGNDRKGSFGSGAVRCAGDDRWVVIDVKTEKQWNALSAAQGLATREDLQAWAAERDRDEVVAACIAAGVAAAPVFNEPEMLADDLYVARDFWVGQDREVVGFHLYPAFPIIASDGSRPTPDCPAPLLGEHTVEVLAGLGISEAERRELVAAGVAGAG